MPKLAHGAAENLLDRPPCGDDQENQKSDAEDPGVLRHLLALPIDDAQGLRHLGRDPIAPSHQDLAATQGPRTGGHLLLGLFDPGVGLVPVENETGQHVRREKLHGRLDPAAGHGLLGKQSSLQAFCQIRTSIDGIGQLIQGCRAFGASRQIPDRQTGFPTTFELPPIIDDSGSVDLADNLDERSLEFRGALRFRQNADHRGLDGQHRRLDEIICSRGALGQPDPADGEHLHDLVLEFGADPRLKIENRQDRGPRLGSRRGGGNLIR